MALGSTQPLREMSTESISWGVKGARWDVGMWTGLGWPRIGTGGGRLRVR